MGIIAKPNTFSPSTTISSSQVNANFDTIYNDYNGGISAANLATDAVTTAKIADSNVTTAKINDSAVTTAKIADDAVTEAKITLSSSIATVSTSETTTSTSYADLATTTDTVTFTVPSNGKVKITLTSVFSNNSANQTYVSVALSGGNTLAANDTNAMIQGASATNFLVSRVIVLTGLTAASTTFKMKYRVTGGTGTFSNRSIIVEPFL